MAEDKQIAEQNEKTEGFLETADQLLDRTRPDYNLQDQKLEQVGGSSSSTKKVDNADAENNYDL